MGVSSTPSVSIIVPVYNTAPYVTDCLATLQRQGDLNFEAIVVDDGSTDESHSTILGFIQTDSRFRFIRQENRGLAEARNTGLRQARGDYVLFLDSDDIVLPDTLVNVFRQASESRADVQCFRWFPFRSRRDRTKLNPEYSRVISAPQPMAGGLETLRHLALYGTWQPKATQYLIRRIFLEEHSMRFEPGILYEDNPFTFELFVRAKKVCVTDSPVLGYRLREESITRQKPTRHHIDSLRTVAVRVKEIFSEKGGKKRLVDIFVYAYVQQNIASQLRTVIGRYLESGAPISVDYRRRLIILTLTLQNWARLLFFSAFTKPVRWFMRFAP